MSAALELTQADYERAGRELKQSALLLAQSWQALAKAGWSGAQVRPLLLALRQVSKGCDRLRLPGLKRRVLTLETQLIPFVSAIGNLPQNDQARAIEANVSALTSSILALDLNQSLPTLLSAKPANEEPPSIPAKTASKAGEPVATTGSSTRVARMSESNTVFVLRADHDIATGLVDALRERGHRIVEVSNTQL